MYWTSSCKYTTWRSLKGYVHIDLMFQLKVFDHGVESNVIPHPNIHELARHSNLVKFLTYVRPIFMHQFDIHKEKFQGVNSEAMFAGTVLHSLDHTMMEINLGDPLWLDTEDSEFKLMAQLGQIVRVGFVPDVPGLYFHKRFKGSGHPFYEAVYERAAKINDNLADKMDTCIIK